MSYQILVVVAEMVVMSLGLAWTRLSGMYTREKTEVIMTWLSSRWLMTIVYLFPLQKVSKKQCPG